MPTLHNPLGWVLSQRQRKTLADIARAHDLVIIEDAAYAYLANRPPPPVAVFAPERTLYINGFSKNVATGLRVGAVICPDAYRGHWNERSRYELEYAVYYDDPGM